MKERIEQLRAQLDGVTNPSAVPHVSGARQKLNVAESALAEAERLTAKAGTDCVAAQAAHATAEQTLILAEEAAHAAVTEARTAVTEHLDLATNLIQEHLKLTVVDEDPERLRAKMDEGIMDMVAHQPLNGIEDPANTVETLRNAGVPAPFDVDDYVKRNAPKKPEMAAQASVTGAMLVADLFGGFLFGLGVLTLLGQVQERTFLMDFTGPILAALIGFATAVGVSYVIKITSEEAASRGSKATWIALLALFVMMTVEIVGASSMLQIAAANRQFMTGNEAQVEFWKLGAIAALSLMFSGVVVYTAYFTGTKRGRERFEAHQDWAQEKDRVRAEAAKLAARRTNLITNCEKLKSAVLNFRGAHSAALDKIDRALMDCKEKYRALDRSVEAHERAARLHAAHPAFDDEPFLAMEREAEVKTATAKTRVEEVETFLAQAG